MPYQDWIKTLEDGRIVKFTWLELEGGGTYITAQLAGNPVVYSIVLTKEIILQGREDVESQFKDELAKK